jgi:ElaB/YqjD/DUF883 family membrane-anchored ribosome-binding protein
VGEARGRISKKEGEQMTEETAMNAYELKDSSRAKLITDVKAVVADAQAYLDASVGQTGEVFAAARKKLEETLNTARAQVAAAHRVLAEKTRAAARATDTYVHEKPWESVVMGAGVGLLLGLLIARR